MRERLKRKFIMVSMTAISIVLFTVMSVVIGVSYYHNLQETDRILEILSENNGSFPIRMGRKEDMKGQPGIGPETPFQTRYFTVILDEEGNTVSSDLMNIMAVNESKAYEYAIKVIQSGKEKGTVDVYRYLVNEADGIYTVIFVDDSKNMEQIRNTVVSGVSIGMVGLLCVFVLLYVLSDRVISPIVESQEKQKRFITDASHELKTPLTVIGADVELLEMETEKSEWSEDIRMQCEKMTQLTGNLIQLARMDEEHSKLTMIELPLSDIVRETSESFVSLVESRKRKLIISCEPLITAEADETAIRQLIGILLDNAVKYSKEGTQISLHLETDRKYAKLTVSNEVENPYTKDQCRHLFDRFYRTDESRSSSGFGLGLSIGKEIVLAHKGKIQAYMEDEHKFAISVTLPIKQ